MPVHTTEHVLVVSDCLLKGVGHLATYQLVVLEDRDLFVGHDPPDFLALGIGQILQSPYGCVRS